ncbi:hypothetical protein Sru01_47630 [Sphaerisporangium rufum]|uniref:Class F sortase n=1 Tax=Sphaerisporangium rufum TaxID=1381558 RepID=A0A919V070_9ACTN|nr:class F sortase [Sphaerisporangium rufum]GII79781.1 hypothetical protein Sru01_47630 [Sphaerisporangium rufum]
MSHDVPPSGAASRPAAAGDRSSMASGAPRWRRALLPALLTGGSLAGIGAVMAGLLLYLSPDPPVAATPDPAPAARVAPVDATGAADGTPGVLSTTAAQDAAATVGPGGDGVPLAEAAPAATPPVPAERPVDAMPKSAPVRVRVPSIGVDAPLMPVGVTRSGEIEVPPLDRPRLAGWYRLGPAPGEMGPAVILGHVNNRSGPAVFGRLRELGRGDRISVVRADGSTAVFTVDGAEQASKSRFPTRRVYGQVDRPALRLITCGGVFNPRAGSYTDNIIVYATLTARG